jgi:hypothetical protein
MGGRALLPVIDSCVITLRTFPYMSAHIHSSRNINTVGSKSGCSSYSDYILIVDGTRLGKEFKKFATTLSVTKLFKSLVVCTLFKFISFLKLELLSYSYL